MIDLAPLTDALTTIKQNLTAPVIELRDVKHFAAMSRETSCFVATLYVDGVKFGTVENDGGGGCDMVRTVAPFTHKDEIALEARIKATVPATPFHGMMIPASLETLTGDALNKFLCRRDMLKAFKTKVVFKDGVNVYTMKLGTNPLPRMIDHIKAKYPAAIILNTLPEAEALALYTSV